MPPAASHDATQRSSISGTAAKATARTAAVTFLIVEFTRRFYSISEILLPRVKRRRSDERAGDHRQGGDRYPRNRPDQHMGPRIEVRHPQTAHDFLNREEVRL